MNRNFTLQSNGRLADVATLDLTPESARVRFGAEANREPLSAMAERDLDAALQLLAERAQYITGASGAAIAVGDSHEMTCRASVGDCAPALGLRVQTDSGLSGESVRTRQILRCDDTDSDPRVNRESCRALNIASLVVMPLVSGDAVAGLFELFSSKPYTFQERDVVALQHLAEIVQTALERADAAKRTERELARETVTANQAVQGPEIGLADTNIPGTTAATIPNAAQNGSEAPVSAAAIPSEIETQDDAEDGNFVIAERGHIGKCASCGFPISEGRELCVDCERVRSTGQQADSVITGDFAGPAQGTEESWLQRHKYVLAALALLVVLLAVMSWVR